MRTSNSLLNSSPPRNYTHSHSRNHSTSSTVSSNPSRSSFVDHHDRNFFDDTDLQTSTQGTSLTPSLEIPEPSSSGAGHRKKKNHGISSATNPTSKYQPAVSANAFYTPGGSASSSQAMQSINSADTSPSNSTSATSAPMTRGRGRPSSKAPLSDMPARQISTRRGSKRKVTENAPAVNGSAMDDTHSSKPLDVAEGTVSPVSKKSRGSSEVPPLTTRSTRNKRKATEFSSTTAFNNAVDGPQSSQGLDENALSLTCRLGSSTSNYFQPSIKTCSSGQIAHHI
jgi:hypothetical protein